MVVLSLASLSLLHAMNMASLMMVSGASLGTRSVSVQVSQEWEEDHGGTRAFPS